MADLTAGARLRMRWPRRALAFAALGGVLVAAWAIARDVIWPNRHGAQIEHLSIDSRYVHRTLGVTVVLPANAGRGRPLLVFLHGRNGDEDSEMRNRAMFDELAQLGRRAPVIAFPYGGSHSYWHDRRDGRWYRYVTREVISTMHHRFGTDTRRVAIGGISMGGFG